MFQKKEIIYSDTLGVCIVDDIVKLADNRKDTYDYYLLRSVYDREKKAYIPVENHTVQLRPLITLGEAQILQEKDGFDSEPEQVKGEIRYVIGAAAKKPSKARKHKLSENSENTIHND